MWHGYVEQHTLTDPDRKAAGAAQRLTREPEVLLSSPDEVAEWIGATRAQLAKGTEGSAAMRNALMVSHSGSLRGVARRGGSVYSSLHATADKVWDICAEVTR